MSIPEVTVETPLPQEKVEQNVLQPEVKVDEVREDPNWKAVRELRKKEKAEREAAERRAEEESARAKALAAALEQALSKSHFNQQQQQQNYAAYPEEETEDQRIERKVLAAIAQREVAYEKARAEREKTELPQRLKKTFPDYEQVVNEENGAYLEYHHPELYRTIANAPENYETCSDIYKLVKKYVPNATTAKKDEVKAENNFNKPRSMSSTSVTQGGEPGGARLSDERKAQNWADMQRRLKGLG